MSEAVTTYGVIGVKVWIFKGEILGELPLAQEEADDRNGSVAPAGRRHRRDDNQARNGRGRRGQAADKAAAAVKKADAAPADEKAE